MTGAEEEENGENEEEEEEEGEELEEANSDDELDEDDANEQASSKQPAKKKQRVSFSSTISTSDSTTPSTTPSTTTPALPYAATKIFTPKDFALLRQLQQQQKDSNSTTHNNKKRSRSSTTSTTDDNDSSQPAAVVNADDLIGYTAKRRKSKEERLDSVREGREGLKGGKLSKVKGGGSTNAEKLKSKPFMLVKFSQDVRGKQRQKFSDVQKNQQVHIKNLKNQGKKAKKKMKAKRGY